MAIGTCFRLIMIDYVVAEVHFLDDFISGGAEDFGLVSGPVKALDEFAKFPLASPGGTPDLDVTIDGSYHQNIERPSSLPMTKSCFFVHPFVDTREGVQPGDIINAKILLRRKLSLPAPSD